MKTSTGVITGKFAPLHSGHIYAITQASTQVDHLYVILSYDDKFFDTLDNKEYWKERMSMKKRMLWLKRTFHELDHITVLCFDETNVAAYPEGALEWSKGVQALLSANGVDSVDKWFSSEPEYSSWINAYWHGTEHVVLDADRDAVNISATKIRQSPFKYWKYLPSIVRKEFLLKVAVIGTESSAKSTLVKYLAKVFNTSWVEEYGRTYCEVDMCMDGSLLAYEDYATIASNRYYQEKQAEATANAVLFLDTEAFVTQYYCVMLEGKKHPLVEAYIEQEKYDLVLHLSDEVRWVEDGIRITSDREYTGSLFNTMLDEYKVKDHPGYRHITGNYQQRLNKAIAIVKEQLAQ